MKSQSNLKWNLSLEPGYQTIYWSLCWLTFFVGLIAWLEYTELNGITLLFWLLSIVSILTAKTHYLKVERDQLFFSFLFKRKKQFSLVEVDNIAYSTTRLIVLYSHKGNEITHFYLNQKQRNRFLSFISVQYPTIAVKESLQPINK